MNREELKQKILEHSNSMFPLIDFFNDIGRNKDPRYDKERAYEDIEKIYDVFIYYREKSEKLENAIEILKEKIIDRRKLLNSKNVEEYNNYALCGFGFFDILTQEEYDLLKEVLENE